ncbi:MAG: nucleotide exchange factor GrpE [Zoogloeaceae bacterium]|nr:nucleotide exchange factor GrpE [Zoogloeaceae bacterium]
MPKKHHTPPQPPKSQPETPAENPTPETDEIATAEPPAEPEETFDPLTRIAELEAKLAESEDNWLRAKAETENIRRRSTEEVAKARKFSIEQFAGDLLAVKDSLEAALANENQSAETLHGGVELTLKQLISAFDRSGIQEINPLHEKFDPNRHQAIQTVESEQDPNMVAFVLQKGYLIAGRVLRPAMVFVTRARESS